MELSWPKVQTAQICLFGKRPFNVLHWGVKLNVRKSQPRASTTDRSTAELVRSQMLRDMSDGSFREAVLPRTGLW